MPHSSVSRQHIAVAYHCICEMIAAKILGYYWIDGKANPADIVSKYWGYKIFAIYFSLQTLSWRKKWVLQW
jgi:hypothetical protein